MDPDGTPSSPVAPKPRRVVEPGRQVLVHAVVVAGPLRGLGGRRRGGRRLRSHRALLGARLGHAPVLRGCGGRPREAARRPVARRRPGHLTGRPGLKGAALAGWRTAGRSCAVGSCVRPPPPPPGPLRAGGPRAWGFTARDPLPAPPAACCVPGRPGPGRLVPQRPESKCRLQMRLILRMLLGKAAGCVGLAGGEDGPHGDGGSCGCRGELGHRAGDALPHTPHRPAPAPHPACPSVLACPWRPGRRRVEVGLTHPRLERADPGEVRGPGGGPRSPRAGPEAEP